MIRFTLMDSEGMPAGGWGCCTMSSITDGFVRGSFLSCLEVPIHLTFVLCSAKDSLVDMVTLDQGREVGSGAACLGVSCYKIGNR